MDRSLRSQTVPLKGLAISRVDGVIAVSNTISLLSAGDIAVGVAGIGILQGVGLDPGDIVALSYSLVRLTEPRTAAYFLQFPDPQGTIHTLHCSRQPDL